MNILQRVQRICKHHELCESCLLFSAAFNDCWFLVSSPVSWDINWIKARLKEEEYEHRFGK